MNTGDRVQLAAHTDWFAMGDRFGTVVKVGTTLVHVHMDRSGRTRKLHPDHLTPVG